MIDICDFAVGLSRQLHGLTIASERPGHRMMEQWHPLGVVGVITAFNFPVAVWAWNAALALVCGDSRGVEAQREDPAVRAGHAGAVRPSAATSAWPRGAAHLSRCSTAGADVGQALVDRPAVALLSATGSTRMGRAVGPRVAARFGRSLLELGGNNAIIVAPRPIWTWPCAASPSAPTARPASAAPPRAA
jgi:aldehyde dehydrogenase (NAD+)